MKELDLFAEDTKPKTCGECAVMCRGLSDPSSCYCDLSKKTVTPETPACETPREKN